VCFQILGLVKPSVAFGHNEVFLSVKMHWMIARRGWNSALTRWRVFAHPSLIFLDNKVDGLDSFNLDHHLGAAIESFAIDPTHPA
jgi:hypothetical protein